MQSGRGIRLETTDGTQNQLAAKREGRAEAAWCSSMEAPSASDSQSPSAWIDTRATCAWPACLSSAKAAVTWMERVPRTASLCRHSRKKPAQIHVRAHAHACHARARRGLARF
eukprot:3460879-Pleurochrysis_carterae.AAC.2